MRRPNAVVALAALAQLGVWLGTMGDYATDWEGGSVPAWLSLEAVVAVLLGAVARDRATVTGAVVIGWLLQAVHFAVVTPKGDEYNLAGLMFPIMAVCGAVAYGLALAVQQVSRIRSRARG